MIALNNFKSYNPRQPIRICLLFAKTIQLDHKYGQACHDLAVAYDKTGLRDKAIESRNMAENWGIRQA